MMLIVMLLLHMNESQNTNPVAKSATRVGQPQDWNGLLLEIRVAFGAEQEDGGL